MQGVIADFNNATNFYEVPPFDGDGNIYIGSNEDLDIYKNMNNIEKMYFNIYECSKLLDRNKKYDLVIRIRPDISISLSKPLDLMQIYELSKKHNAFFVLNKCGIAYNFTAIWGFGCDDSFAIGSSETMLDYANTYIDTVKCKRYKVSKQFLAHRSLAYNVFYKGINVFSVPEEYNYKFKLEDREKLKIEDIKKAILKDIANRTEKIESDQVFIDALT